MTRPIFSRKRWALHNPLRSWTLKDLTAYEVKLVVAIFTDAERQLCLVWRKGWDQWRRLKSIEEFDVPPCESEIDGVPPIPANLPNKEREITQVKILSQEPARMVTDRRHGRHNICVPVEIIQGAQTFRTETVDISISGVRFKDSIPDWVAGYFTVLFQLPQQSFEITCALVEDQKQKKDCAEVFDTNDEESGLKAYIEWVTSLDNKAQSKT